MLNFFRTGLSVISKILFFVLIVRNNLGDSVALKGIESSNESSLGREATESQN
jgi:hypothetical protein